MAELKTETLADLNKIGDYARLRDSARDAIAKGVYPNCLNALHAYGALSAALVGELSDFADFHNDTMSKVLPHVASIQEAMQTIVGTVKAIDKAVFDDIGTDIFGTHEAEGAAE